MSVRSMRSAGAGAWEGPAVFVIPCYNEADRLSFAKVLEIDAGPACSTLLVDDGSVDGTRLLMESLPPGAAVLRLPVNVGKGEAVRHGMLRAIDDGARYVGYADADFATPARELLRLLRLLRQSPDELDAILGSRVQLAGRLVVRRPARHYLGRVVATWLSVRSRLVVYDTQCGAKVFTVTPELRRSLAEPFLTRWLFDVELLVRLRAERRARGAELALREEPLEHWEDVGSSRLTPRQMFRVAEDLRALERSLRRSRQGPLPTGGTAADPDVVSAESYIAANDG